MEALELPAGLRVIRPRVDRLDAKGAKAALELDLTADQATGEADPVVAEHLGGEAITADGPLEALPGGLGGGSVADSGGQAEPGVIVEDVHHPHLALVSEE
jgi:hypothetical protein